MYEYEYHLNHEVEILLFTFESISLFHILIRLQS